MSKTKKNIRSDFREDVFQRAKHKCQGPKCPHNTPGGQLLVTLILDAHHITDRTLMPNGGYVKENGIALCPWCHEAAEMFHSTGESVPGYSPEELYAKIGSSYNKAVEASHRLGK